MADHEAVLFDMDGVIVDSEDYWHEAEREEILPWALGDDDEDDAASDATDDADGAGDGDGPDLDEITGMNFREIYDYLDEEYGTAVTKAAFVDRYDETAREVYGERVELLDGFGELRADLRDRGVAVAVVSSSPHDWIDIVRERFDLGPFDLVCSAEDVDGPGKPEPAVYEAAADALGVDPADCLVVEDSENGAEAGARAGASVVGYRREHNADTDLSAADAVVDSPAALREALSART